MRKLSPALVISIIALFVALGGAGMAATGGSFILGKGNSATSTTSLVAPIGSKALQVWNTSTTAGATALGLNVALGHPPFAVNSTTKVSHLNADMLDGIDSSGFVQGAGGLKVLKFHPTGASTGTQVLSLGGLRLTYTCTPNAPDILTFTATTTVNGASVWLARTDGGGATVEDKAPFNIGDTFYLEGFVGTGVYTTPGGVVVTFTYRSAAFCNQGVAGTAYGG